MNDNQISFVRNAFNDIIQGYKFYHISDNISLGEQVKRVIQKSINDSKITIVDQSKKLNHEIKNQAFILGFEKTIIILQQSEISFLEDILIKNPQISICFLPDTKEIIHQKMNIQNHEIIADPIFKEEIKNLSTELILCKSSKIIKDILFCIAPCISGYLIKKSYLKTTKYRIKQFINENDKETTIEIFNKMDFVELPDIGIGSSFFSILIYHIKNEELYMFKKQFEYIGW